MKFVLVSTFDAVVNRSVYRQTDVIEVSSKNNSNYCVRLVGSVLALMSLSLLMSYETSAVVLPLDVVAGP